MKSGRASSCKACESERNRKRYAEQTGFKERIEADRLRNKYGITPGEREGLRQTQGGLCAVCRDPLLGGKREHIDHCHKTGRVRGILCSECNTGLGKLHDDPKRLMQAAIYLMN